MLFSIGYSGGKPSDNRFPPAGLFLSLYRLNVEQVHVENENRIGRNATAHRTAAVSQIGRHPQLDLAGENGVELSAFFNKKIGAGLFGGEGFIMQKASGHGIMFAEFDGHVVEYELEAGEQIVVDTGHLAAMTASCTMEIKSVPGVKNMLFGGEGVFNTILTGPGEVWLQTMPISNVAGVLSPYFPSSSK